MTAQRLAFERELSRDAELVARILRELPAVEIEPERVLIKCDVASVDAAICKALGLTVEGIEARLELITL